ncbi:MAG TPA: competence/damage-inducible protein A [Phycisphaerae bacterium]|jgi:nicotinamide-nucleotide amidase
MNAILLSIGDELVSGLTLNTNSAWLAEQLAALGIGTLSHVTIGDDLQAIVTTIRDACERLEDAHPPGPDADKHALLLISGGLGPTEDDLTRQGLAEALNQQLVEDPDAMLHVSRFFKTLNRPMAPSNRLQAMRPHGASILENSAGTAPGLYAQKEGVHIYVMPGVPREMREMFTRAILPKVREHLGAVRLVTHVTKFNTFGLGESNVGERIQDLMARTGAIPLLQSTGTPTDGLTAATVGTTVHEGIVSVRLYCTGTAQAVAQANDAFRDILKERLGPLIFSQGDEALETTVADLLLERRYTVATAESCTGGLVATLLTNTPGSSTYFLRGWVTYANTAKHEDLAVPAALIDEHGSVSEPVARAMAAGAKHLAETDFAISTTGIAGPGGATPEKPVGTVWIALASPTDVIARKFIFPGNRSQVRLRAAQMSLAMLRWKLLGVSPPA